MTIQDILRVENSINPVMLTLDQEIGAMEGWCTPQRAKHLAAIVFALRPTVSCLLGIFGGRDLLALALAHQAMKHGKVHGVDPWSKEASCEEMSGANLDWWQKLDHSAIEKGARDTINRLCAPAYVEIHKMRSDQFPIPETIDLLCIDSNHSEKVSCWEAQNYAPRVTSGGILFSDDVNWANAATKMLPDLGFTPLYQIDTGIFWQKKS